MAEFIAQRETIARVVIFSGGWDHSGPGRIANWYFGKSVTPADRWYGTYNVAEPLGEVIAQTYAALKIPTEHIFALNLPVRPGKKPHVEGIANPAYAQIWKTMLGSGAQ